MLEKFLIMIILDPVLIFLCKCVFFDFIYRVLPYKLWNFVLSVKCFVILIRLKKKEAV